MLPNNEQEPIYGCDKCPGLFSASDFKSHQEFATYMPQLNACSEAKMISLGLLEDYLYSPDFYDQYMKSPLSPKPARTVKPSRQRKNTSDTNSPSTRKLSTRKARSRCADPDTGLVSSGSRSQKAAKPLSQSKSKKASRSPPEPMLVKNERPLDDTSDARKVFWGIGPSKRSSDSGSNKVSSSQPATDPSDISKDFPNEDLMTLFQESPFRDLRGDYGRL